MHDVIIISTRIKLVATAPKDRRPASKTCQKLRVQCIAAAAAPEEQSQGQSATPVSTLKKDLVSVSYSFY